MSKPKNEGDTPEKETPKLRKIWQVPEYADQFARDGVDQDRYAKLVGDGTEPITCTPLFDIRVRGKVKPAGEKITIPQDDFRLLAAQGRIKEVMTDKCKKVLEESTVLSETSEIRVAQQRAKLTAHERETRLAAALEGLANALNSEPAPAK